MRIGRLRIISFLIVVLIGCLSQNVFSAKAPFNKGVNITGWFQVDSPQQIQFTKYTRTDFEQIKSLGCDVVRLPINLHSMTKGAPDYILDPLFLSFLDQVVGWCEDLDIHLIIDNHTFDVTKATDPGVGTILEKVWTQMATHYLAASTLIYFEVLNEPHGIADNLWNTIQQKVVTAIRKVDTKHTIVVGPASWNSYNNLAAMPVYADTNLIYTFHFYDPFLFTHQGASWSDLTPATGIPFPYNAAEMPACPAAFKGTWIEGAYGTYKNDGNEAKVKALIDIAVKFSEQRNVPLFCGEFGVYDLNSPPDDRVYWYEVVRNYLEEKNIGWTIWDYHGAFGLFEKNSEGFFDHDLNVPVLEALGLNVPEQTPYVQTTDSAGFEIYSDFLGSKINNASYGAGVLSFYSTNYANRGEYCISWSGAAQYAGIVFDFKPNKDLRYLAENGYALSMLVRSDKTNGQFDLRFIDSKTDDPADHPWRIRKEINKNIVPGDKQWHKLYLPLSAFTEHGSWDNNTWYNPETKFDWQAIDKLEISMEYSAWGTSSLWFDDIVITNQDTLTVDVIIGKRELQTEKNGNFADVSVLVNQRQIRISASEGVIHYQLVDVAGRCWEKGRFDNEKTIGANHFPKGFYLLYLSKRDEGTMVKKILLN